jgi:hypothetical protein
MTSKMDRCTLVRFGLGTAVVTVLARAALPSVTKATPLPIATDEDAALHRLADRHRLTIEVQRVRRVPTTFLAGPESGRVPGRRDERTVPTMIMILNEADKVDAAAFIGFVNTISDHLTGHQISASDAGDSLSATV